MGTVIWLIGTLVLAGLELAAGEFTFLMLAGGAAVTAGASLFGLPVWAEIVIFGLSSAALILFLRPWLHRRYSKPRALDTSPKALVGSKAHVLEDITPSSGQVRLDGSIWSARAIDPAHVIAAGEHVIVADIDGPTAVVWKE
ncbi:NfeD family protein [Corynebacterium genitalium ATCC 33030]|uniref:NfeD family protein n=1 Tax=Corynebacterium TaxID=1716 RepID=UPI0005903A85|nr:NfeD family protein [Corynebacterium genitalium]MCQ4627145.1 NfeD family protein [Corynebacterium sp. CCUG 65737]UUA88514.1 NfeD family protein [Corynebacterium genitalium ATCC 33030]